MWCTCRPALVDPGPTGCPCLPAPHPACSRPLHGAWVPCCLQLHPSCARVAADDDGLLPEWMVYHELVSTGRVYLSKASVAR